MIGFVCGNPEMKVAKNGTPYTKFKLSVRRSSPSMSGRKYDRFNCTAFKKVADIIYKKCNDGAQIAVSGYLVVDDFQAQDGSKRYVTVLYVNGVDIIKTHVNEGDRIPMPDDIDPETGEIIGGGADEFVEVDSNDAELPFL